MATAQQQQQPLRWDNWTDILKVIEKNPNKALTLSGNTLYGGTDGGSGDMTISSVPGSPDLWQECVIEPAGHLSAYLYCTNHFFADAPMKLRQQMLVDAATEVAADLDQKIRTTDFSRYRKKALEWLGTPVGKLKKEDSLTLWEILAAVFEFQCLVINSVDAAEVRFAPSDVRTWSRNKPLVIVNEDLTHVWISVRWTPAELLAWLDGSAATATRNVKWPAAEGTKLELLEAWEKYPAYKDEDRKKRKDELALLVGKAESIKHLMTTA